MFRINLSSLAVAAMLFGATDATAQVGVPPVQTNFAFSVPFLLAVSHPCQPGFVLLNGSTNLAITTVKSSSFSIQVNVTGTGTGKEAGANGVPLSNGSSPYQYATDVKSTTVFPEGTPVDFAHTLTVAGEFVRDLDAEWVEVFGVTLVLDLGYTNGIPTTPALKSIDVKCQ